MLLMEITVVMILTMLEDSLCSEAVFPFVENTWNIQQVMQFLIKLELFVR